MYQSTIGLEIHIELKTKTKMFCDCLNPSAGSVLRLHSELSPERSRTDSGLTLSKVERINEPDEKHPNINVCPICLGHPGTLPTINKKAVESVLKLGLALNSKIPEFSKFDRKNYFYPDLPKGYQISQYDKPLVLDGKLNGVKIRRIHLEEDTARLVHSLDGKSSLVDFNRAGIPLMELVTEPDIKDGKEAVKFAEELQLILRYLEISDADMEKGQMRVEVNISIRKEDEVFGTKVEIKNLNSFRAVEEAIDYEIKRQTEILEKGEKIKQETRGWDEFNKSTKSQRVKEEAHDYRYFSEPDLPPLDLTKFNSEELKISIPELPKEKRQRFINEYKLEANQVEILVKDRGLAKFFEEAASELREKVPGDNYQLLFNYLTSDLLGLINKEGISVNELKIKPEHLSHIVALIEKKELSSRMAKDILVEMFKTGLDPQEIIKEKGIAQISDEESIEKVAKEVIAENPEAVSDYKKGKANALQFLIGKVMAKSKGRANPEIINKLLIEALAKIK